MGLNHSDPAVGRGSRAYQGEAATGASQGTLAIAGGSQPVTAAAADSYTRTATAFCFG